MKFDLICKYTVRVFWFWSVFVIYFACVFVVVVVVFFGTIAFFPPKNELMIAWTNKTATKKNFIIKKINFIIYVVLRRVFEISFRFHLDLTWHLEVCDYTFYRLLLFLSLSLSLALLCCLLIWFHAAKLFHFYDLLYFFRYFWRCRSEECIWRSQNSKKLSRKLSRERKKTKHNILKKNVTNRVEFS